ncbi:hypothetical protein N9D08_01460, partial [bacterium]|nr:hypothetical protein [bacterium]
CDNGACERARATARTRANERANAMKMRAGDGFASVNDRSRGVWTSLGTREEATREKTRPRCAIAKRR